MNEINAKTVGGVHTHTHTHLYLPREIIRNVKTEIVENATSNCDINKERQIV